jgi:large subunit ribosomal protein L17
MRHAKDHRKLGRTPSHRKALLKNLLNSLIEHERITTTVAKAKELRRIADRAITLGKKDTTHARRMLFAILVNKKNTAKVFDVLAKRYMDRNGGYTRVVKTGFRAGDAAEMAIIEYLPSTEKKSTPKKSKKKK